MAGQRSAILQQAANVSPVEPYSELIESFWPASALFKVLAVLQLNPTMQHHKELPFTFAMRPISSS